MHRTLQVSVVCFFVFHTLLTLIPPKLFAATAILMVAHGVSMSAFLFMVRAMVADYGDKLRLEQGMSRASLLYSIIGTTGKIGSSVSVMLALGALQFVGSAPPGTPTTRRRGSWGLR